MPLEWVEDPRAFVARDWTDLVEADPEASFFHTPRYLKLYWEEFGADRLLIGLEPNGTGAAAFEVRGGVLAFLGGTEVTDYMGPVGPASTRDAAAKEVMAALAARDDWDAADLAGVPEDGTWLPALESAARDNGLVPERDADGVAPFLQLPGSCDEYLAGLPGKLRHEIRRKERRLREGLPDVRLVDARPETVDEALDAFIEMHRSSRGEKGRFMVPGMQLFFRRLAEELIPDGTMRLSTMEADGRPIAAAIGFRWRDRFLLYNSAYDHAHAQAAPGMVLVAELIRTSIEEGRTGFDMLKGDLSYKYRFGARPRRVCRLRIRR